MLSVDTSVSIISVFLQGLLSFFSPCIFPLIPLYMGYLAGGIKKQEDGKLHYNKIKAITNTIAFVLGISFTFLLLGLGATSFGTLLNQNKDVITVVGGTIIVIFGLYQLGIFGTSMTLMKERKLPININKESLNILSSFLLGLVFSFGWTPCVGPILTSVLIMVGSAESMIQGLGLMGIYTLGFVIPFLFLGIFTGTLMDIFAKNKKVIQYTVKIAAIIMIIVGLFMIVGEMEFSKINNELPDNSQVESTLPNVTDDAETDFSEPTKEGNSETTEEIEPLEIELKDQYGNSHKLSDYKGKTIFLHFWATWCGYCKEELPDLQKLYEDHNLNKDDVAVITVLNPNSPSPATGKAPSMDEIKKLLDDNGVTFPVLMDETGSVLAEYGIYSFPTVFMIDENYHIYGYLPGAIPKEYMEKLIEDTKAYANGTLNSEEPME